MSLPIIKNLVPSAGTHAVILRPLTLWELRFLEAALFEDLLDDSLVFVGTELVVEGGVRGGAHFTLGSMLSSDEDLECTDELYQRNGLVPKPLLCSLYIVNHDNEVILLALEVALGLGSFSASHDDRCIE